MSVVERRPNHEGTTLLLILLSLLAHLLLVLFVLLVGQLLPKAKARPVAAPSQLTLQYVQAPRGPKAVPKIKRPFFPTRPDPGATAQKAPLESSHDVRLHSENQTARDPAAFLPDVTGQKRKPLELKNQPEGKPTPPIPNGPKSQGQPAPPAQPAPTPGKPQATTATPPAPAPPPKPQEATSPKTTGPTPAPKPAPTPARTIRPQRPPPTYDPSGLPVLPPIDAPAMAAPTIRTSPPVRLASSQPSEPSGAFAASKTDANGTTGLPGENTPATRATALGRYKAKVYGAIGALWHQKIRNQLQVIPIGTVHIHVRIWSDGRAETEVIEDTGSDPNTTLLLRSASLNSIIESAPFDPFPDELKIEVGQNYEDDFSFTIYGG